MRARVTARRRSNLSRSSRRPYRQRDRVWAVQPVTLGPEQERRLGGIRIPFVDLRFEFSGLDAAQRKDFQARFDRSFQKGGG